METNPATDAALVKLELLSRHVLRLHADAHSLADELERVDDEIGELMFELAGVAELPDRDFSAAFSATLERIDGLVEAGGSR